MPISDFQTTSGLASLDTKALAADRLLTESSNPPAPKEDFSKVFARVHKPREPERQDLAADKPRDSSVAKSDDAHSGPARGVDDSSVESSKEEGGEQPKQPASVAARAQLLRLLRALQLADGASVGNGADGANFLPSANGKAFKASQLSDSVSVITAGTGPSEAEILAYAKELGLSPDAIKALMAEIQANGLLGDQPLPENDLQLGLLPEADGEEKAQGQVEPLLMGAQPVAMEDATSRWLSSRGQLAGATELSNGSVSGQPAAGLKGDGSELGQSLSDRSAKEGQSSAEASTKSTDTLSKAEKLLGPGGLKEMLIGKAAERAMANEAMMKTALVKDAAITGPLGFESIDLSEFAAELSNPFDRPALSASSAAAGTFGLQASMGDSSGRSMAGDTGARQDGGGGAARTFSAQLSQRFGEILGQRLLQQIGQGNWKVELNLEPGDLGSIKVEMEFKKGELEASFKAGQAMTKDLLQDTLPRLREALERSGITIASMNVGGDRQERSGDSLSQQHSSASARRQPDAREGDDVELDKAVAHRSHDGTLDVLV
jgi:hypothetical protein